MRREIKAVKDETMMTPPTLPPAPLTAPCFDVLEQARHGMHPLGPNRLVADMLVDRGLLLARGAAVYLADPGWWLLNEREKTDEPMRTTTESPTLTDRDWDVLMQAREQDGVSTNGPRHILVDPLVERELLFIRGPKARLTRMGWALLHKRTGSSRSVKNLKAKLDHMSEQLRQDLRRSATIPDGYHVAQSGGHYQATFDGPRIDEAGGPREWKGPVRQNAAHATGDAIEHSRRATAGVPPQQSPEALQAKLDDVGERYRKLAGEHEWLKAVIHADRDNQWVWMGDPNQDDITTLSSSSVVMIKACELRGLMSSGPDAEPGESEPKPDRVVSWTEDSTPCVWIDGWHALEPEHLREILEHGREELARSQDDDDLPMQGRCWRHQTPADARSGDGEYYGDPDDDGVGSTRPRCDLCGEPFEAGEMVIEHEADTMHLRCLAQRERSELLGRPVGEIKPLRQRDMPDTPSANENGRVFHRSGHGGWWLCGERINLEQLQRLAEEFSAELTLAGVAADLFYPPSGTATEPPPTPAQMPPEGSSPNEGGAPP